MLLFLILDISFYQNIPVESLCNIYKSRKPLLCALEFGLFKYFWPVRVYTTVYITEISDRPGVPNLGYARGFPEVYQQGLGQIQFYCVIRK